MDNLQSHYYEKLSSDEEETEHFLNAPGENPVTSGRGSNSDLTQKEISPGAGNQLQLFPVRSSGNESSPVSGNEVISYNNNGEATLRRNVNMLMDGMRKVLEEKNKVIRKLNIDIDKERQEKMEAFKKLRKSVEVQKFVSREMNNLIESLNDTDKGTQLGSEEHSAQKKDFSDDSDLNSRKNDFSQQTEETDDQNEQVKKLKETVQEKETKIQRYLNLFTRLIEAVANHGKGLLCAKKSDKALLPVPVVQHTEASLPVNRPAIPCHSRNAKVPASIFPPSSLTQYTNGFRTSSSQLLPLHLGTSKRSVEVDDDDDLMITAGLPPSKIRSNQPPNKVKMELTKSVKSPCKSNSRVVAGRHVTEYSRTSAIKSIKKKMKNLDFHARYSNKSYKKSLKFNPKNVLFTSKMVMKRKPLPPKFPREKKFPCDICGYRFVGVFDMNKHKEKVHKVENPGFQIGCRNCGEIFSSRSEHAIHRLKTHPSTSRAVPKASYSRSTYIIHYHGVTSPPPKPSALQPLRGLCDRKDTVFGVRQQQSLALLPSTHGFQPKMKTKFTCKICQLGHTNITDLDQHMDKVHKIHAAPYRCSCGKGYYHEKMFEKHYQSHEQYRRV